MPKSKIDLFRFATVRSPQTISEIDEKIGFIHITDFLESDSRFFDSGGNNPISLEDLRSSMKNLSNVMNPISSLQEIKDGDPQLWKFSQQLLRNKGNWSTDEFIDYSSRIVADRSKEVEYWDNVFYDILEKKNKHVRQGCLQMLVALNFLKKVSGTLFDDHDLENNIKFPRKKSRTKIEEKRLLFLRRLANATVVIPPQFIGFKDSGDCNPSVSTPCEHNDDYLGSMKLPDLGFEKLDPDQAIMPEIIGMTGKYRKNLQKERQLQFETHEKIVASKIEDYIHHRPGLENKLIELRKKDPNATLRDLIPPEELPKFEFNFPDMFSEEYLKGAVSDEQFKVIKENGWIGRSQEFVEKEIEARSLEMRNVAIPAKRRIKERKVWVHGVPITLKYDKQWSYRVQFMRDTPTAPKYNSVHMFLDVGYKKAYLKSASFQLTFVEKEITYTSNEVEIYDHASEILRYIILFEQENVDLSLKGLVEFKGEILLNDGSHLVIDTEQYLMDNYLDGSAKKEDKDKSEGPGLLPEPSEGVAHYGIERIGVRDYRRVEQELCCYIPGEVSHIENVMAREYKEKNTRNLRRSQLTTDTISSTETENLSDVTSTDRNEMSTEIAKILENNRSNEFGVSASANGEFDIAVWSGTATVDSNFGLNTSNSSSDSNTIARQLAQDITSKALERIVQKSTIQRTSVMLKEFEENNRHGFDNREGDKHVTGVFRWVDKVYKNRLVNYGKRLQFEFAVPEPAKFYLKLIEKSVDDGNTDENTLVEPESLESIGVNGASNIDDVKYQEILSKFPSTLYEAPKEDRFTGQSLIISWSQENDPDGFSKNWKEKSHPEGIVEHPDYNVVRVTYSGNWKWKHESGDDPEVEIWIGGVKDYSFVQPTDNWLHTQEEGSKDFSDSIGTIGNGGVSLMAKFRKTRLLTCSFIPEYSLKTEAYRAWQDQIYIEALRVYQLQLDEYNAAIEQQKAAAEEEKDEQLSIRPEESLVINELKRIAIEMILHPFGIDMARNYYTEGSCCVPLISDYKCLDKHYPLIKFLEQAFDWQLMSFTFYPYYWADRCDWKDIFQAGMANDGMFKAFLQSGMARLVVPVKKGLERAVTYFMESGDPWTGTPMVVDTDDKLYISVADELNYVEGFVEDEWDTSVPTSLTLIQAKSALLDDEGLPCCDDDDKDENLITEDDNVLERLKTDT